MEKENLDIELCMWCHRYFMYSMDQTETKDITVELPSGIKRILENEKWRYIECPYCHRHVLLTRVVEEKRLKNVLKCSECNSDNIYTLYSDESSVRGEFKGKNEFYCKDCRFHWISISEEFKGD